MPSAREMRLRIRSVKNISQVTRALEAVSAARSASSGGGDRDTSLRYKSLAGAEHIAEQPGGQSCTRSWRVGRKSITCW